MCEVAISKLNAEMNQNANNPYIQVVGGFLIEHLNVHPEAAEKIINKEKTIGKSLDEMRKVAEKKKVGNCAVLTDQEGFGIVLKYFDIKGTPVIPATANFANAQPVELNKQNIVSDFNIKLEDLL